MTPSDLPEFRSQVQAVIKGGIKDSFATQEQGMMTGGRVIGSFVAGTKGLAEIKAAIKAASQLRAVSGMTPALGAAESMLIASKEAGGHLLARHVGMTEAQLAARLAAQRSIPAASTFSSTTEAAAAVTAAFDANAARIATWVSNGAKGRLPLNAAFVGGTVLQRGAAAATRGTGVRVILQGNGQGGYHILTGFPTP